MWVPRSQPEPKGQSNPDGISETSTPPPAETVAPPSPAPTPVVDTVKRNSSPILLPGNANRAEIVAVMGMTGTGKTQWLIQRISKPKRRRLLVWSPKEVIDQYGARFRGAVVTSAEDMRQRMIKAGTGPVCLVFSPPGARKKDTGLFSSFCEIARAAGNLTVIVEELHTVTQPSAAPDGWSKLCLMGRGYGVEIYALSQRPASCDKDFFGNCTMYHTGRLGYLEDAIVMGRLLNVAPTTIMELPDLHYLEREPRAVGPALRGVVKIKK